MKCRCCTKDVRILVKVRTEETKILSSTTSWLCMECMFRLTGLSEPYSINKMPDRFFTSLKEEQYDSYQD